MRGPEEEAIAARATLFAGLPVPGLAVGLMLTSAVFIVSAVRSIDG